MRKHLYSIRKFAATLFALVLVATLVTGCRKEDSATSENYQDVSVEYAVSVSSGSMIKAVITQVGTAQTTTYNPTATDWKSPPTVVNTRNGAVYLSATGMGKDANASMTLTIKINGVVTDAKIVSGTDLVAKAAVQFPNITIK